MNFYSDPNKVKQYIQMAEGYDGKELIARFRKHLAKGCTVLELGMGPGKDLDMLAKDYQVTGSDLSTVFLDLYRKEHKDADLLQLDAVSLQTEREWQGIYSNKVLHHLSKKELSRSLLRQRELIELHGIALHSFWKGSEVEEYEGLKAYQYEQGDLVGVVPEGFRILELSVYSEMDPDDSLCLILQAM